MFTVIGSTNVDIHGRPSGVYRPGDSNPGRIALSVGGVGCNIARDLSMLGEKVRFLTALGTDHLSRQARAALEAAHLDLSLSVTVEGGAASVYMYITDDTGEMVSAVSDMAISDELSPAALARHIDRINDGGAVVFDANLREDSIVFLAENVRAPLAADGVSTQKAARLRPALGALRLLKCNRMEAAALTGAEDAREAALRLLAAGVHTVFITMGTEGVLCAERGYVESVPRAKARKVVDSTGAGDAFLAGALHAMDMGLPAREAAEFGQAAAALTCEAYGAVDGALSHERVAALIKQDSQIRRNEA